jgi:phosphate transport system substrate-binding protein
MSLSTIRRTRLAAVAAVGVGLLASACGSSSSNSASTTTAAPAAGGSSTTAAPAAASIPAGTLNGSGSTFQAPFDDDVITAFDKLHSGVTINYAGGGSGKGQSDLQSKLVDFAGSDSLIKDTSTYTGGVLYFPTVIGPITVSYNLSGVSKLTLSAPTIAKIFSGKITTWNDPAIKADNPGVTLPSTTIVPVHRSDGSGTTSNFTKYLSKADPTDWTLGSASTVNWPAGGQAGNGNPGVAGIVGKTAGAIGYVDYSDAVASNLTFASIVNSAGKAEAPTLAGASAAAQGATIAPDLTYDPTNSPDPNAYPITSPTWIIVYKTQSDQTKAAILKGFLDYILTTAQGTIAKQDSYAPLPANLQQMAIAQLSQL